MRSHRRTWGPRLARGSQPPEPPDDWLAGAVRAWYPKLAHALGDEQFTGLLGAYLRTAQPRATVRERGLGFADYLAGTPELPLWFGELARLDRAHIGVMHAASNARMARKELVLDREIRLITACALVDVTTSVDELWSSLDRALPPVRPRALDWPRTVLVWRAAGGIVADRTVWPDESAALHRAAHGTSLAELARSLAGDNPHARALDLVVRWIDDGVVAR